MTVVSCYVQMTPRKPARLDPAKLTPIGSLRPEFAMPLPVLSLRDRFSPVKLLPVRSRLAYRQTLFRRRVSSAGRQSSCCETSSNVEQLASPCTSTYVSTMRLS